MSKENKTSDKQQNGNDFIADVSKRFFRFKFINNGEYSEKTFQGKDYWEAYKSLQKSLTGLFNIIDYEELNVC